MDTDLRPRTAVSSSSLKLRDKTSPRPARWADGGDETDPRCEVLRPREQANEQRTVETKVGGHDFSHDFSHLQIDVSHIAVELLTNMLDQPSLAGLSSAAKHKGLSSGRACPGF